MQHLGVGEHDVRVLARPGAVVAGGVAVVGDGAQAGDEPRAQRPQLVLGERLGREDRAARCRAGRRRPTRRSAPGSRATCPTRCRSRRRRSCPARSRSIAAAWCVYSRSMPRASRRAVTSSVQRLRQSRRSAAARRAAPRGSTRRPGELRVRGERVERVARVHRASRYLPHVRHVGASRARRSSRCGSVRLERGVVGEVGEQAAGVADEREAAAAADRDRHVADRGGVELLRRRGRAGRRR